MRLSMLCKTFLCSFENFLATCKLSHTASSLRR
nr:MAG TPA: hypothetical protein [Caudoviricetes sp.]